MAEQRKAEQWGSRLGVILAVAGSAVGLGNFLRFPGLAAQNGGGAFMIPYFVALLLLGIPLGWAEWTMGRYGGLRGFNSAPGIYSVIWRHPLAKYFGGVAPARAAGHLHVLRRHRGLVPGLRLVLPDRRADAGQRPRDVRDVLRQLHRQAGRTACCLRRPQRVCSVSRSTFRRQLRSDLPRHRQGHRRLLQMGHADHGRLCPVRARPRLHARHARPGPAGAEPDQRPGLHVESRLRRPWPIPKPGWPPPGRFSSPSASASASSSTIRAT